MNSSENMKNNLITFIKSMEERKGISKILHQIFDARFNIDDRNSVIKGISIQISEILKSDPNFLLEYLTSSIYYSNEQFENYGEKFINILETINEIKINYGVTLRDLLVNTQNPFIINGLETNVAPQSTLHKITFIRSDGESLNGLFSSQSLMAISTGIIESLHRSMLEGVFNIEQETLARYLNSTDNLNEFLADILRKDEKRNV